MSGGDSGQSMAKIAVVDLMFHWPPHGGACTDLRETFNRLQQRGHQVSLFVPHFTDIWPRGRVRGEGLDFPFKLIKFDSATFHRQHLPQRFRQEVDQFKPDYIFLGDSTFLKPYLIEAFKDYPIIARFYTYELICFKYYEYFRYKKRCNRSYLTHPIRCLLCSLYAMGKPLLTGRYELWSHEFVVGRSFYPGYYRRVVDALRKCQVAIVYNKNIKKLLDGYCPRVVVIPGGVDISRFPFGKWNKPSSPKGVRIVFSGRANDKRKGLPVLIKAGKILRERKIDFQLLVTTQRPFREPWIKPLGWLTHEALIQELLQSDIAVVPSVWEEPFGMVAVEAMACGLPVVASRVGGLQEIVEEGATGFLVEPMDYQTMADRLETLCRSEKLRESMGKAGRKRAEELYDWDTIVDTYYPSIFA
ncbi:hypothetical protein CEE39_08195 [bacterium (candidate division B38) B3_B38]|nr:MAG: hypothetical protein CEE39_08195 [bacterium (candidate division B38) B3_B38]